MSRQQALELLLILLLLSKVLSTDATTTKEVVKAKAEAEATKPRKLVSGSPFNIMPGCAIVGDSDGFDVIGCFSIWSNCC